MSWNKNTVVISALDATINVLEDMNILFDLSVRGIVPGRGLNDSDTKTYGLRRLGYGDHVILEQMERTCDCDFDDTLDDKIFTTFNEPENFPLEVFICVCGYDCYNINREENERSIDGISVIT